MKRIKELRRARGLTQAELAKMLGFSSASAVGMWETGARKPSSDKLPRLAEILGCTIDALFAAS